MLRIFCVMLLLVSTSILRAKDTGWTSVSDGQLIVIQSTHAPFPHPKRSEGHTYSDSLYIFAEHYNDSSVAIFIPDHFVETDAIELVFYFHGWNNNIQRAMDKFRLLEQFTRSRRNAVFVFPEGPKNAPDSFGGRLEEKDVFKGLVQDVLSFLKDEQKVKSTKPGDIVLAGHSGAYHVISFILNRGGLTQNIREVYLFDALYGQSQKYAHWVEKYNGRMVNVITPNGGTHANSLEFLDDLQDWGIPYQKFDKNVISTTELSQKQVVFVFTTLNHNQAVDPFFEVALRSGQ